MLIAEELVLALYDDQRGSAKVDDRVLDIVLAGAVLVELATEERVRISEPGEPGVRKGRLVMIPSALPADQLLADAMELLRLQEGRKPKEALGKLGALSGGRPDGPSAPLSRGLRGRLLGRLADAGMLRLDMRRVLRIFTVIRWPSADPTTERQVRKRLRDVLVTGRTADARTSALVAMLVAIGQAHKVLGLGDRSDRRQAKRRAKQIAEGNWASDAVKKAVKEVQSAASGGGGGGDGGGGDGGGA